MAVHVLMFLSTEYALPVMKSTDVEHLY